MNYQLNIVKFFLKTSTLMILFFSALFAEQDAEILSEHTSFKSKDCAACHTDKNGKSGKLIIQGDDLCFKCHTDIKQKVKNSKNKHGAINMGGSLGCHNPHNSTNISLLKEADSKTICLTCHSSQLPRDEDGKMLLNMGEHLANNPDLHGPIMWGDCAACHDPHGSDNLRMLKKPFPEKPSTIFSADKYICFECHEPKKITDKFTTEHTAFRNGDKNIHFFHVNTKRVTCKTCHDYHGSKKLPHHLKNVAEFGTAKFSLRFIESPTGGSCNPVCHTRRYYDRVKPVNVRTNKKL